MKVLLVNITKDIKNDIEKNTLHPHHVLPPLDIGYCAALLEKNGHEVLFIDTAIEQNSFFDICQRIIKASVDIVVLKPNIMTYKLSLKLADEIKSKNRYIVCIGPVVSTSYDFFLSEKSAVDLCIIGEPEYTLSAVVEKLSKGKDFTKIPGTSYFNKNLVVESPGALCNNLDDLPFPKHDFFIEKGYHFQYPVKMNSKKKFAAMLTSRGCPYSCLFCSPIKRVSFDKAYRVRSAKNVVDEMELLQSKGINLIYFLDDLFTFDYARVALICDQIIKRKLSIIWAAQIRADSVDLELLKKMKNAGCGCVYIGIESANDALLKMLKKGCNVGDIERTVRFCQRVGINTVGGFIIGIPGQTKNNLSEDLKFAKKLNLDLAEALLFIPYPDSEAFNMYGKLEHRDFYSHYDNAVASYCELDINELKFAQQQFYRGYYLNLRFISRFFLKNTSRIIRNLFSEASFLKNTFLFLSQKYK